MTVKTNGWGEHEPTCAISSYIHCRDCMDELPDDESPMTYQRVQAGFTQHGVEVWCVRHDKKIIHIDFEDQKHPTI